MNTPRAGRAAVVCGLGTCVPPYALTNEELSTLIDTSDAWIRSRTGIGRRHIADASTATSDLAIEAGGRALKSASAEGNAAVDAVIVATTTPDHPCPATAPLVATRLGLGTVPAFDVAAVCTGFLYGLAAGAGLIAAGTAERVLVIGAETFSRILDPEDRSGRAIFGDGAGAVVLRAGEPDEPGALGPFDLGSDGTGSDLITVRTGGSRDPYPTAGDAADPYFRMNGKAVFRNAVERMTESSRRVLAARTDWTGGLPDLVVAHQANLRILHAVADRIGVDRADCFVNIDRVGNTAAASIPLALGDADRSGALSAGRRVLLTAFGGGLTWGACTLTWPDIQPA
ncbi:3-oxoacyl-ACP synthase [Streptomyces sp. M41(2017)]|uniref:beta-ketoacyl-ACP synthase III n=1 Tax=Streptomyces sp. M41(2017) TaxID=1955065 RepID=UPI0009C11348|nr:beta-ketoacyl-ACP synthase III [Streptomyces sp. M41(2017)]OQQ19423.1 3-oxoacyl-ACP synthase [Streptomyces sp. M41(2017)]